MNNSVSAANDSPAYSKTAKVLHASVWLLGFVLFNIPSFDLRVGVFTGGDGSLLIPSSYGILFNMIIFYGNADFLLVRYLRKKMVWQYLLLLVLGFFGVTLVESLLDFGFYHWLDVESFPDPFLEMISTNLLLHFIFFLLPSFFYRFAKDWLSSTSTETAPVAAGEQSDTLNVKSGGTLYPVKFHMLRYVESDGNYLRLHTEDDVLVSRDSLANLLKTLPADRFIRCHKSFIVAKQWTKKIDYDFVYLNKEKIPIGRQYRNGLKRFFA